MSHRNRRRTTRIYRWEGEVTEVGDDWFLCRLIPVDCECPELIAEIDLEKMPFAFPGCIFNLYIHRKGKKQRTVFREKTVKEKEE